MESFLKIAVYLTFPYLITPPARRAWRSYKFALLRFSIVFSVLQVGLPLMGDTAVRTAV